MDRQCQELVNRVYEAASSWNGKEYKIAVSNSNSKRRYLGMSGIGNPCKRALWYGFRGFDKAVTEGRTQMIFELGNHVEQIQIHWLEAAGYKITDRQATYEDHNGFFKGHPDGIIHGITQKPHVWDAKSINKKGMEVLKKLGMEKAKPVYYDQAQMMMHYSGCERAIYTFMCKDNCEWYAERFYYNPDESQKLIKKALQIITSEDVPEDKDDMYCQWCDYRLHCQYPEETILSEKTCGTCYYFGFKKGTSNPICKHPSHPLEIKTWGICCADWLHIHYKELPGKEKYPQKKDI